MPLMGGFGDPKPIDDDVKALVDALKAEILAKAGAAESEAIEAISYTSQVVAGTNFLVKLKVAGKELTVKIFRPLPHTGEPPKLLAE